MGSVMVKFMEPSVMDEATRLDAQQTAEREALRGHRIRIVRAVVYEGDAEAVFDQLDRSLPVRRKWDVRENLIQITVSQGPTADLGIMSRRERQPEATHYVIGFVDDYGTMVSACLHDTPTPSYVHTTKHMNLVVINHFTGTDWGDARLTACRWIKYGDGGWVKKFLHNTDFIAVDTAPPAKE